ncbi:hypothetical protein [Rhodococcus opacus]|uniref:hypothetical protein n=1 Tax=Rhodococcus opacus TaxID=37919 RepID=UPI00146AE86F
MRVPIRIAWAPGRGQWLLARRSLSDPTEIAYYICAGPRSPNSPPSPGRGGEWRSASSRPRTRPGLDQYQVRTYRAWYVHTTLSMLALA